LVNAFNNRGAAYKDKGDYDRAMVDFGKAIEIDPKFSYTYMNRGVAYKLKGDLDRAIADYTRAIELNPTYAGTYRNLGEAHGDKHEYNLAIRAFTMGIAVDPNDPELYNDRAWAFVLAGKAQEGLPDAERSLALRPDDAHMLDTRGSILEALGR